jgi:flagellin
MALNAARNLAESFGDLSASVRRLSSGLRISVAADDPAGLAVRELMRAEVASLNQGMRNANDAVSLIQTADGALGVIDEKLIRMKELAEQAATGTYNSDQRLIINSEYLAMASEITRIADATDFNGIHLLNGNLGGDHDGMALTATGSLKVHFGSGNDCAEDYYYIAIDNATAEYLFGVEVEQDLEMLLANYSDALDAAETAGNAVLNPIGTAARDSINTSFEGGNGVGWQPSTVEEFDSAYARAVARAEEILTQNFGPPIINNAWYATANTFLSENVYSTGSGFISISTQALAQESLDIVSNAIVSKDKIRASLGSLQNRLQNTVSNLKIQGENLQASESAISDADLSLEMSKFVRNQILSSAATAMLAQANSLPRMALSLLSV